MEDERVGETPVELLKEVEGRCRDPAKREEVEWLDSCLSCSCGQSATGKKESRADLVQPLGSVWSLHNPVTRFYLM